MKDFLNNYTTYTVPPVKEPPLTLDSLLQMGNHLKSVQADALENARCLHKMLTQHYGDVFLPPEQWPFYGIGLDMSKPGADELLNSVRKALERAIKIDSPPTMF